MFSARRLLSYELGRRMVGSSRVMEVLRLTFSVSQFDKQ
jgi:hypothetical protein